MKRRVSATMAAGAAALAIACTPALAGGDPARGRQKATATCAACHGMDGNSASADYPRIAGQYEDYLAQALSDYQRGKRRNPIMQAMAAGLSKEDIQDLAAWFASQSGLTVAR